MASKGPLTFADQVDIDQKIIPKKACSNGIQYSESLENFITNKSSKVDFSMTIINLQRVTL